MIMTIVFSEKVIILLFKDGGRWVYVATIHDKNTNSFKLSHDRFALYLILFRSTYLV